MRVLMISKACIVGQYQTKLELLARKPDLQLTVVVPPSWRDERGILPLEREHVAGYQLVVAPLRFNGHYHLHFYPTIAELLHRYQPDLVHLDEEPYNFATFHALWNVRQHLPRARSLFFTWQNLPRTYPPPFPWMERYVYAHSGYALAGSETAREVLRAKGFHGPVRVVPQFGVPETFRPSQAPRGIRPRVVVGFTGRLVPEKGGALLLRALAQIEGSWELHIVGSGPQREALISLARDLGISDRVCWEPWQSSTAMPGYFNSLDLFVAPSISVSNWKEQFGRVLIEAMACGVAVIGSSSGEIPNLIGDAGLVFPEGRADALADALGALIHDPALRQELGARGRTRVLEKFSQARIAEDTYAAYRALLGSDGADHAPLAPPSTGSNVERNRDSDII